MIRKLLEIAPLAVFALGALTFSTLTAFYWGGRRLGAQPGKPGIFPAFTLVCGAAFLSNLLFQVIGVPGAGTRLAVAAILIGNFASILVPLLILHLVLEMEPGLPGDCRTRAAAVAIYAIAGAAALLRGLNQTGLAAADWSDGLYRAPAVILAATGLTGLARLAAAGRSLQSAERAHRRWIRVLLVLMLACAAANLGGMEELAGDMPDYLVLAFFCVSLYYRERLVFVDLLVKRGVYLAAGLLMLAVSLALCARFLHGAPSGWSVWVAAMPLIFWLAGPWVYSIVERAIDRKWLHRPYSPMEAELRFARSLQSGINEDELMANATESLQAIFRSPVKLQFDRSAPAVAVPAYDAGLTAELRANGARLGTVRLDPRPNGVPFLSDDRRLLQSLATTLSLTLENLRFRAERQHQHEREQQLRWLATRAELKALRAQIDPHFLFNALSAIAGLVHYRPALADETIERLAQVLRYTLRRSENEWTPLAEELDFVLAYLRIEQARFGGRLHVEFEVDPAAERIPIPAMTVQPLVENAIRHGTSTVAGRGIVTLKAALEDRFLAIGVCDNGPGFPPGYTLESGGDGHGLRNVADRLRGYYGDAARLTWENRQDGARVALILPRSGNAVLQARTA